MCCLVFVTFSTASNRGPHLLSNEKQKEGRGREGRVGWRSPPAPSPFKISGALYRQRLELQVLVFTRGDEVDADSAVNSKDALVFSRCSSSARGARGLRDSLPNSRKKNDPAPESGPPRPNRGKQRPSLPHRTRGVSWQSFGSCLGSNGVD